MYSHLFQVCDRKRSCFDPHLTYWKPEFMMAASNFIVLAFKGTPQPSVVNDGSGWRAPKGGLYY